MGEGKSPHGDLAAVHQRLARLERERWVWRIGAGVVLAGLYLATWATASPGVIDEVRARKIVVVDAQGKGRIILGTKEVTAELVLFDMQGKERASLDEGALFLFDERGNLGVWLSLSGLMMLATSVRGAAGDSFMIWSDTDGRLSLRDGEQGPTSCSRRWGWLDGGVR
jgi:hypothetical protein